MTFETLHSEITYRGRAFAVRRDRVRLPNGNETHLDIVEHSGAVTLLPIDAQARVWFVRQYRHPAELELLELPAGTLEPDEPPKVCARREIREEIGMAAGRLQKLGSFFLAPGYSTEFMHVFLATDLSPAPLPGDVNEILHVERLPLDEVYQMAEKGRIQDAKTLAALLLARPHLQSLI
ncbi:MAG: NUDIX hydrolase [Anaerolineales bacterium]|jgi:ADP-ribose pyrophosphatase